MVPQMGYRGVHMGYRGDRDAVPDKGISCTEWYTWGTTFGSIAGGYSSSFCVRFASDTTFFRYRTPFLVMYHFRLGYTFWFHIHSLVGFALLLICDTLFIPLLGWVCVRCKSIIDSEAYIHAR